MGHHSLFQSCLCGVHKVEVIHLPTGCKQERTFKFKKCYGKTNSLHAKEAENKSVGWVDNIRLKLGPNPVSDVLFVNVGFPKNYQPHSLLITDIFGREIASFPVHTNNTTVDLSGLHTGVYLAILMKDKRHLVIRKISKL